VSEGKKVVVVGGGGHAKVVVATLRELGHEVVGVFDDNPQRQGGFVMAAPVLGPISAVSEGTYSHAVIAIGDNRTRQRLARQIEASNPDLQWLTVIHPRAYVHPSAQIGLGTVLSINSVVEPECRIGAHVIVNSGATVAHDCVLGDFVHVAPGAHLAGGVQAGEGVFCGTASAAIPGVKIGEWTTLGAGGVAVRDLPPRVIAVGVPAKVRREAEN
jgi:sugar O-acyltransferase (sialic acid O-acetyltransferase NeuD family)